MKPPAESPRNDDEPVPGLDADLRAMFDQMLEGVQLVDADFRYRYLNESAAQHGQRHRDELIGRLMPEMYPGIEHTDVFRRIAACLTQRVADRLLTEFTFPNGSTGWFDIHLQPVPVGVLILSVDVTAQKRAEEKLGRTVIALQETDRRKTELLAMLAHELRNPLAAIRSGLHVLRAGPSGGDTAARAAEAMDRQIRHLSRFVDGLLDVNRIISGKITLTQERLDLGQIVRAALADQTAAFASAGVSLTAEVPALPVWVNGDDARLGQVFACLLDNARSFTPKGGQVTIRLTSGDNAPLASVEVRDTGVGIAGDALPFVFEPLFQEDRSLERARGGLGIGLAIARGVVELHGGTIAAASDGRGRGTAIRLHLPRESEPPALAPAPPAARAERRAKRVLLIEDNRDAAETLAMVLDLWGYEVGMAFTGSDGLAQARANRPDIVLCDIGLPGIDGYAVARALRGEEATKSARLIAVTGYGRDADRASALAAGFDLHLAKPVQPEALRSQLEL